MEENMKQTSDEKKIITVRENEEGDLLIGEGAYVLDEGGFLIIQQGMQIPRILISDLREYAIYVRLEDDGDVEYEVSADNEEYLTVGFGIPGYDRNWIFAISPDKYIEILERSLKMHPEYSSIIEYSCEYVGTDTALFDFVVKVTDEYLDDAIASGFAVMEEILKPIREVERFIEQKIKELQR
jgi:hypothetical protein